MTRKRQAPYPEGIPYTTPSFHPIPHPTSLSNIVAAAPVAPAPINPIVAPAPINQGPQLVVPATIWQQIVVNPALTQYLISILEPNQHTEDNGALTNGGLTEKEIKQESPF
ncbi:Protein CBG27538 [Caenorhabditis briggsae]|uniref:Uncharacterized protein n=2 Tax=Caenorhabditis briggsae TaxID=6238 RepID=A0AAE9FFW6_CAEBR|nr:Protein CBG27538 [Caenorhabditis briggsae]ULT81014.1 hypothetical protein L3Y34_011108 [Caenorhabditis briggsae]UMM40306.1 hypothetical protein L5515_016986 [Caenorhabditis briggsae]CAS00429.1 Protein CBG27538 [Caenorhabditis briggsae]